MMEILKKIEKAIVLVLIVAMLFVVILATVDLGWNLVLDILSPPAFLLDVNELLDIFGYIMLVLIGLELLETIRLYFKQHVVRVEVVLEVALIAIARKVIILDVKSETSMTLLGIAGIIVSLGVTIFFLKQHRRRVCEQDVVVEDGRDLK